MQRHTLTFKSAHSANENRMRTSAFCISENTKSFRPEKEAARSSEASGSYHITTWGHKPEDIDLNLHRREHLKSRIRSTSDSFLSQEANYISFHRAVHRGVFSNTEIGLSISGY